MAVINHEAVKQLEDIVEHFTLVLAQHFFQYIHDGAAGQHALQGSMSWLRSTFCSSDCNLDYALAAESGPSKGVEGNLVPQLIPPYATGWHWSRGRHCAVILPWCWGLPSSPWAPGTGLSRGLWTLFHSWTGFWGCFQQRCWRHSGAWPCPGQLRAWPGRCRRCWWMQARRQKYCTAKKASLQHCCMIKWPLVCRGQTVPEVHNAGPGKVDSDTCHCLDKELGKQTLWWALQPSSPSLAGSAWQGTGGGLVNSETGVPMGPALDNWAGLCWRLSLCLFSLSLATEHLCGQFLLRLATHILAL